MNLRERIIRVEVEKPASVARRYLEAKRAYKLARDYSRFATRAELPQLNRTIEGLGERIDREPRFRSSLVVLDGLLGRYPTSVEHLMENLARRTAKA